MHLHPANFDFVDPNWKPLKAVLPILKDTDPKELGYGGRHYQLRCYDAFEGQKRTLFISPTGSGKSLVQIFCAAREIIESDYKQKQVFIVPQLNIGNGFTEYKHKKIKINGKVYDWEITENCCLDNAQSVVRIKNFLLKTHSCKYQRANNVLGGCTAVVSYNALLLAFKKMTPKERLTAIKNTSFRPDEVHHISGVDGEGENANCLGEFCKFVCDNDGHLHLTTATFFRGDQGVVLSNEYLEDFEIFRVPFLEHWKTLGLKELHQNYVCYKDGGDLLKQILDAVASEPNEPPIIIVPADGLKFFKNIDKWKWVKDLVVGLSKVFGEGKVLDLVSADTQAQDKKRLISDNQDFSAIVTCQIGREGTDWVACSRVHNTILDANVLQPIQKLGRALRQDGRKVDVKMVNYIEHFEDWDVNPDIIREKLSDRFNAVVAASMLDDMFCPIMMPTLPINDDEDGEIVKSVSLEDVYGSVRNNLIEDMMRRVLSLPANEQTGDSIDNIIQEIIEEYQDDMLENVSFDVLKNRLRKEIVRRQNPDKPDLRIDGMLVNFIRENGWDKVVREHVAAHSPFVGGAKTADLEALQKYSVERGWDFIDFKSARAIVHSLKLRSQNEWNQWCKSSRRKYNIPSNPRNYYDKDWVSWGDWLGTGNVSGKFRKYLPFEKAKEIVQQLNLQNQDEYSQWSKLDRPDNIPSVPSRVYEDHWKGWGDWLGTGKSFQQRNVDWMPFVDAATFVKSLNFKDVAQWRDYCKSGDKPANIPSAPDISYKEEWKGYKHWIGIDWMPFEQAREFARSLKLNGQTGWHKFCKSGKRPENIPSSPSGVYKEWNGWGDWLGTGRVANQLIEYLPFEKARKYAISLGYKNRDEWMENRHKLKKGIPVVPRTVYEDHWKGWGDWLGTGKIAYQLREFMRFEEARKFAIRLNIKTRKEWYTYHKNNNIVDIPRYPESSQNYEKEWCGWIDFLGAKA